MERREGGLHQLEEGPRPGARHPSLVPSRTAVTMTQTYLAVIGTVIILGTMAPALVLATAAGQMDPDGLLGLGELVTDVAYEGGRRRLQETRLSNPANWAAYSDPARWPAKLKEIIGPLPTTCEDPLASNLGAPSPCTYACSTLTSHYFPSAASGKVRCFVADPSTGQWPADLLALKKDFVLWDTYKDQVSVSAPIDFTLGELVESCTPSSNTTTCDLIPGNVTGGAGAVGRCNVTSAGADDACTYTGPRLECTPIITRFTTTTVPGTNSTFDLDGTSVSVPAQLGAFDVKHCLHDANYTLTKSSTDTWAGTVSVFSYVDDNTIYVPNDESWIIQGTYSGGLPLDLDARVASGLPGDPTKANIVLRHLRISKQLATFKKTIKWIDENGIERAIGYSMPASPYCQGTLCGPNAGGAFEYFGGHQATLIFDHVTMDHNMAMRAGTIMIDGVTPDPSGVGTTIIFSDCVIWENILQSGGIYSAGLILYNMWPLRLHHNDVQWIDQDGYAGHVCVIAFVPTYQFACSLGTLVGQDICAIDARLKGDTTISYTRNIITGPNRIYRNFSNAGSTLCAGPMIAMQTQVKVVPEVRLNMFFENNSFHDNLGNIQGQGIMHLNNPAGLTIARELVPIADIRITYNNFTENYGVADYPSAGAVLHGNHFHGQALVKHCEFLNNGNILSSEKIGGLGVIYIQNSLSTFVLSISDSSFTNSINGQAGSIYMKGHGQLQIARSTFLRNKVRFGGGAIKLVSAVDLAVTHSAFTENTVMSEGQIYVTIRMFSGTMGGTVASQLQCWNGGCINPVFKIDGVVPNSTDGSVGNDPVYGNNYMPGIRYAETVLLTAGTHTLWTGGVLNSKDPESGWKGGYIEIIGEYDDFVVPRREAEWVDNRPTERKPGCMQAAGNPALFSNPCPTGQAFWSKPVQFTVGRGQGGAIAAESTGSIDIRHTTFSNNDAWEGSAMRVSKANSTYLEGATITTVNTSRPKVNPVTTQSAKLHTCELEFPSKCGLAERCTYDFFSVFCMKCAEFEFGNGRICQACTAGTEPNPTQTACDICMPGTYSDDDYKCKPCAAGTIAAESGQKLCTPCPAQTVSNADRTQCLCSTGTYNASASLHVCYARGYDSGHYEHSLGIHQTTAAGVDCDQCPVDELQDSCLTCADGLGDVRPGYVAPAIAGADTAVVSVFRCHPKMDVAVKRCPGTATANGRRRGQDGAQCAPGYRGFVCGKCAEDFGMSSNVCEPCDDVGYSWGSFFSLVGMILGAVVFIFAFSKIWRTFALKHVLRCSAQPLRILITYSQVTGQLGDILDFQFPGLFGDVIDFLQPLMDLFGLLFRALGPSECFGISGFNSRWFLRVLGMPGIMSLFVFGIFLVQLVFHGREDAANSAKSNLFFVVFFCYPTICIVAFAAFMCRPLTATKSFLELDDNIMCEDPSHTAMQVLSGFVIAIVSVGMPLMLLVVLIRKTRNYARDEKANYTIVAKRLALDVGVDVETAAFVVRDVMLGRAYSFVMDAYHPKYLWWEALDMLRKLALTGLVLMAGRGSIAQLAVAIALSFCFFALHMLTLPYKINADNIFRATTEFHVFVAITVALVYQTDLSMETVASDACASSTPWACYFVQGC
eukprot:COSAG01_NODE_1979_length_8743_cov_18.850069_6_plen_1614_part_00